MKEEIEDNHQEEVTEKAEVHSSSSILIPSQDAHRNVAGFVAAPSFFDKLIRETTEEYERRTKEMKNASNNNHLNHNEIIGVEDDKPNRVLRGGRLLGKKQESKRPVFNHVHDHEEDDGEVSLRITRGNQRTRLIEKVREDIIAKVAKERSSASANTL